MAEILIFRFVDCEGPGYLGELLTRQGYDYRLIAVDQEDPIPVSIDRARALVFMGGPMSVNDELPWISPCLDLIQQAHKKALPMLGHCLGGQLLAKGLGASVTVNRVKEIGWLPVSRRNDPGVPDWCRQLPDSFEVFHWHGETFALPPDAIHLFQTDACRHQGFMLGKTLALQFHIEMLSDMVPEWAQRYSDEIAVTGDTVQAYEELTRDLGRRIADLHQIADKIYTLWLATV